MAAVTRCTTSARGNSWPTSSRSERRAIQAMVSLDRVGVRAGYVPICTATDRGSRLRDAIRAAARRADIDTRACTNHTSDHWSYAKVGVPAVRLGGIPYAGYHSRGDVPSVVDRRQLDRVGRTVWAWLRDTELDRRTHEAHCANGPRLLRQTSVEDASARDRPG